MTPHVLRAGQDFCGSQLFGSSFIFEPLQYGLGNLFSTYESFDPPSTPAAEVRLPSISSPWCLLPTGLPTLTTRQVSCHNFTAIRCGSQRSAIAPGANLDDSLASQANGCNFQAPRRPVGKTSLECSIRWPVRAIQEHNQVRPGSWPEPARLSFI